jgi:hypothetical protein
MQSASTLVQLFMQSPNLSAWLTEDVAANNTQSIMNDMPVMIFFMVVPISKRILKGSRYFCE